MASPAFVPNVFVVLDSRFFHAACLIAEPGGCALFVDTTESYHSSRFHHYDEHGGECYFLWGEAKLRQERQDIHVSLLRKREKGGGFTLHGVSAYTPRSIGLRSTEHRLMLHVASGDTPRSIGLLSTEHKTLPLKAGFRKPCRRASQDI